MLEAIELRNSRNQTMLRLPVTVRDPESPFVITNITGLGPVKADINTSTYTLWDGGTYDNSRVGMRNIVMTIKMQADLANGLTVEDLRRQLYARMFPKAEVTMWFLGGFYLEDQLMIDGVVESNEPVMFTKEPEVQISILCPDPHFRSAQDRWSQGDTTKPVDVQHLGTADSGFLLEIFGNPNVQRIAVGNGVDQIMVWEGGLGSLGWDQTLVMSTNRGNKYLKLRKANGQMVSVLEKITSGGLAMSLGADRARLTVSSYPEQIMIYELRTTPKYVGF